MKLKFSIIALLLTSLTSFANETASTTKKMNAQQALEQLQAGNQRFITNNRLHAHTDSARIILASKANQSDHAYATILSCSDSRVPVEIIFDAGIMDIFVIRVAGNEFGIPQVGSFEYGAFHVKTPLIIVLGHTQCGAVTAVTDAVCGHGHELEENIPATVESIIPCVKKVLKENPKMGRNALIELATKANVQETIYNSLLKSPALREGIKHDQIKILGAIYEIETGKVSFLPDQTKEICNATETNPTCVKRKK